MIAAVGNYSLVNTWLVAIAVSFEQHEPVLTTWRKHFLRLGLNYFAGGYAALLLALFAPRLNIAVFFLLAPIPLVLYITLRSSIERVNDQVIYLDTLNLQYRGTIDALAHAIDAKDQVTHGHIRRVHRPASSSRAAWGASSTLEWLPSKWQVCSTIFAS